MNNKKIMLITGGFPYGKNEPFLVNELPYLEQQFEEILLVPVAPVKNAPLQTDVGDNTKILDVAQKKYSLSYFKHYLRALIFTFLNIQPASKTLKQTLRIIYSCFLFSKKMADVSFLCENMRYDVGYSYWKHNFSFLNVYLKSLGIVKKSVCRAHRYDVYDDVHPWGHNPFDNYLIKKIDHVYAISIQAKKCLLHKGFSEHIVSVSRLGVSLRPLVSPSSPGEHLTIISISRVVQMKNCKRIADVVKLLSSSKPVAWHHFGDGPLLDELIAHVQEINLDGFVPHGFIPNKNLIDEILKTKPHIMINLSLSEGVPVSIMEAMSLGVPAVATDVGATAELISQNTGALINLSIQDEEILDKVLKIITDYEEFSLKGLELVSSFYNADKNYQNFAKHLRDM